MVRPQMVRGLQVGLEMVPAKFQPAQNGDRTYSRGFSLLRLNQNSSSVANNFGAHVVTAGAECRTVVTQSNNCLSTSLTGTLDKRVISSLSRRLTHRDVRADFSADYS